MNYKKINDLQNCAPSWVRKIDEASIDIPFAYKGHDLKVTGTIENCPESIEKD